MSFRAYLAGPDVFLPNAIEFGHRKVGICEAYGLKGVFPLDVSLDLSSLRLQDRGYRISEANESLIRSCDLVIANMTPFRGPSCDVGTAYEMGFARALGLPVFAYTNTKELFTERTKKFLEPLYAKREDGTFQDDDGMSLEDFGLHDNLMLDGGVKSSGGHIVSYQCEPWDKFYSLLAFEECVSRAAKAMPMLAKRA